MTWPEVIRDIVCTLLIVIGVLGFFTNTLEVISRGWPSDKRDYDKSEDEE